MGKGTNTTTTSSSPPPEVLAAYQDLMNRAQGVANNPYPVYGGASSLAPNGQSYGDIANGIVAGASPYTQAAQTQAAFTSQIPTGYNTSANNAIGQVGDYANSAAQYGVNSGNTIGGYGTGAGAGIANFSQGIAASGPQFANMSDIGNYMSPYTQNVINSTMANINQSNQIQDQGVIGNAIRSGNAFGGDRMGLALAELGRNQDLASNQTIAGLENQNYSQALGQLNTTNQQALQGSGLALQGLGMGAQTGLSGLMGGAQIGLSGQNLGMAGAAQQAGLYGNLGQQAQQENLAGQQALYTAGQTDQQQQQNQLNAAYQQFMQAQGFPYQQTSWLGSTLGLSGAGMGGNSSTTSPAPNQTGQYLGAGLAALSFLKRGGRVNGYAAGGMPFGLSSFIPTAQPVNVGGLGVPKAPNAATQQAPDLVGALSKGLGPALKGLGGLNRPGGLVPNTDFAGNWINPDTGTTTELAFDPTLGSGATFRRGGLVPHYDDGGYVPDFGQADVPDGSYGGLTADALLASRGLAGPPILPQPRPLIPGNAAPALPDPTAISPTPQAGPAALPPNAMPTSYSPSRVDTQRMIAEEAVRQGVDPELALRVARQESGANPNVSDSSAGAIGPMQLMPGTARDLGVDPRDPAQNIRGGVTYLKQMLDLNGGNVPLALASYNAGPGRVQKYLAGNSGLPSETQNYVASITGQGLGGQNAAQPTASQAGLGAQPAAEYTGPASLLEQGGLDSFLNSPRAALLYAGLGMMASRSPNLGNAIGEGALQGLSTYAAAKQISQKAEQVRAQMQRQDLQQQEVIRHNQATEGLSREQLQRQTGIAQIQALQPVKIGTDALGHDIYAVRDPKTQQFRRIDASALGMDGSAPLSGSNEQPTGEDFLKTLPPQVSNTVKQLVNGDLDITKLGYKDRTAYINLATQYDPSFNSYTAPQRAITAKNFTGSGVEARNFQSNDMAIKHIGSALDNIEAMHNTTIPAYNAVANTIARNVGNTQFQEANSKLGTDIDAIGNELMRTFRGSGSASEKEAEEWRQKFPINGSPVEQRAAMQEAANLLASRVTAAGNRYNDAMGPNHQRDPMSWLSPEGQKVINFTLGLNPQKPIPGDWRGADGAAHGKSTVTAPSSSGEKVAPATRFQQLKDSGLSKEDAYAKMKSEGY